MKTGRHRQQPRYQYFILLLWQEGSNQPWRISLENPRTSQRIGFTSLADLTAYLEKWMRNSSE